MDPSEERGETFHESMRRYQAWAGYVDPFVQLRQNYQRLTENGKYKLSDRQRHAIQLAKQREELRLGKKWAEADTLRKEVEGLGFELIDRKIGGFAMRDLANEVFPMILSDTLDIFLWD